MPPISLSSTDNLKNDINSSARFGNQRSGGQQFGFGGINDSPTGKWVWIGIVAVAVLLAGAVLYRNRRA